MTEHILLAFLDNGGSVRQICVGCSSILSEQGMLVEADRKPMPVMDAPPDTSYCSVTYRIAPPFTLDECRAAVKARHKGPPWGA